MSKSLISTSELSIGYNSKSPLCSGIAVEAMPGEVISLLGANGAGKSTLLRVLSGELNPLSGEINICGSPIQSIKRPHLARKLSLVITDATMTGALTVRQLVSLGRQPYTGWTGILSSSDHEITTRAMECTGILHKQNSPMARLSDGERQKAMIARALAQDTDVMLLDEPLAFLDPAARIEIFLLLRHVAEESGKAVVISCHDVAMSIRMSSRLWLMTTGKQLIQATPQQAVSQSLVNDLFKSPAAKFDAAVGDFIACRQSL